MDRHAGPREPQPHGVAQRVRAAQRRDRRAVRHDHVVRTRVERKKCGMDVERLAMTEQELVVEQMHPAEQQHQLRRRRRDGREHARVVGRSRLGGAIPFDGHRRDVELARDRDRARGRIVDDERADVERQRAVAHALEHVARVGARTRRENRRAHAARRESELFDDARPGAALVQRDEPVARDGRDQRGAVSRRAQTVERCRQQHGAGDAAAFRDADAVGPEDADAGLVAPRPEPREPRIARSERREAGDLVVALRDPHVGRARFRRPERRWKMQIDPRREPVVVRAAHAAQPQARRLRSFVGARKRRCAEAFVVELGEQVVRHAPRRAYVRAGCTTTCGSPSRRGCTNPTTRAPSAADSARSTSAIGTISV